MDSELKTHLKTTISQLVTGTGVFVGTIAVIGMLGYGLFLLMG